MSTFLNDLKYAFRQLHKNPGFAVVVILILALGIGINATAFTVVNAVLFRPLPVKDPQQLCSLSIHTQEQVYDGTFTYPDLEFFQDNADVFEGVLTFKSMSLSWQWQPNQTRKILAEWVSRDYFNILGVKTSLGRSFNLEEQSVPNAYPVVVLSHAFWSSEFDSSPDILGTDIIISSKNYTIVGVAEPGFEGMRPSRSPDLWLPMMMMVQVSGGALTRDTNYEVIGRLRREVSRRNAETQLTALLPELDKNSNNFSGKRGQGRVVLTRCGHGSLAGKDRGAAWVGSLVFLAVTGMVLLIACANMANLLLARAMARRREIATRLALGAGRFDLIRQLLCESLVLALAGGCVGLWLTHGAVQLFMSMRPGGVKLPQAIGLDTRVVVFTVCLSLLTTLIFGLIPALQGTRVAISQALKENQGMLSSDTKRFGVRNILIAAQITLCVVLLMMAGLLLRNLQQTMNIDFGFDDKHTLLVQLPESLFKERDVDPYSIHERVMDQIQALPDVEGASLVGQIQLSGGSLETTVSLPGTENGQKAITYYVGPDYFNTMRIGVKQGREFSLHDRKGQKNVVIINETLARLLWPNENPIGQIVGSNEKTFEVCGIVANSKYHDVRETPQPAAYYCSLQTGWAQVLIVRSKGQPVLLRRVLEEKIHALDPSVARSQARTYTQQIRGVLIAERFASLFITLIGAGGLLLASVGLYGVVSYMGRLRTPEIGMRVALGAQKIDIIRLVVRQAVRIVLVGLSVGMCLAVPFALFLSKLTPFELSVFDPATFVIVTSVLLMTAALACLIPALRAAKIDPMEALRYE
ncbi:MAG: ABC transporter permease [Phycisphaerae bacterium]|nr:ABC transporter permease [Phycisphaerae bacterium]